MIFKFRCSMFFIRLFRVFDQPGPWSALCENRQNHAFIYYFCAFFVDWRTDWSYKVSSSGCFLLSIQPYRMIWNSNQCCFDRLPSSATTFVAIGALQLANVPDHREKFWTINHCWQQNAVVYVICLTVSASFIFLTKSSFPLISS